MASQDHPSVVPSPIHYRMDDGSDSSEDILTGEGRSAPPLGAASRPHEETRQPARPQGSPSMALRGRSVQERTITTATAPSSSASWPRTPALLQQQLVQGQQIATPMPASQQCSSGSGIREVKDKESKDKERPRHLDSPSVGRSSAGGERVIVVLFSGESACGQSLGPPVGRGEYGVSVDEGGDAPGRPAEGKGGPVGKEAVRGSTAVGSGSSSSQHISRSEATPAALPIQPPVDPSVGPVHHDPSSTLVNFDHISSSNLPVGKGVGRPHSTRRRRDFIPYLPQTPLMASGSKRESSETRGLSESQLYRFASRHIPVPQSPLESVSSLTSGPNRARMRADIPAAPVLQNIQADASGHDDNTNGRDAETLRDPIPDPVDDSMHISSDAFMSALGHNDSTEARGQVAHAPPILPVAQGPPHIPMDPLSQ